MKIILAVVSIDIYTILTQTYANCDYIAQPPTHLLPHLLCGLTKIVVG